MMRIDERLQDKNYATSNAKIERGRLYSCIPVIKKCCREGGGKIKGGAIAAPGKWKGVLRTKTRKLGPGGIPVSVARSPVGLSRAGNSAHV